MPSKYSIRWKLRIDDVTPLHGVSSLIRITPRDLTNERTLSRDEKLIIFFKYEKFSKYQFLLNSTFAFISYLEKKKKRKYALLLPANN